MELLGRLVGLLYIVAAPVLAVVALVAAERSFALMGLLLLVAAGGAASGVGLLVRARWARRAALAVTVLFALPVVVLTGVLLADGVQSGRPPSGLGWALVLLAVPLALGAMIYRLPRAAAGPGIDG